MKHVTWGVVTAAVLATVFVGRAQVPPSPQRFKRSCIATVESGRRKLAKVFI